MPTDEQPKAVTCPAEFDDDDVAYATSLVPDGVFVTEMVTVVGWLDAEGDYQWRAYRAQSNDRLSSILGLLDMAKHSLMMDNTNLRAVLDAQDDDDD